jgi:ribosome-associated toxin RatA of RatAB toxin-antitoxin module
MLQHVEVSGVHSGVTADEAYGVLRRLGESVRTGGTIQSIRVESAGEDRQVSHWDVKFREGLLRWSQEDVFDDAARTMTFRQIQGDPKTFEGVWRAGEDGDGCRISFACDFDIGIPSLSATIDPLARRILRETVTAQLVEIFGEGLTVEEGVAAGANGVGSTA